MSSEQTWSTKEGCSSQQKKKYKKINAGKCTALSKVEKKVSRVGSEYLASGQGMVQPLGDIRWKEAGCPAKEGSDSQAAQGPWGRS